MVVDGLETGDPIYGRRDHLVRTAQQLQKEPTSPQQQQNLQQQQAQHLQLQQQQLNQLQYEPNKQNENIVPILNVKQGPFSPGLPYDLYLSPQLQYPDFNSIQRDPVFPRLQLQLVFYGPGGQGQPILINPGSPPGQFFVAGYPKPAHIPPIEKDAEEIPTNPARIPPLPSKPLARTPEKLETFNEDKFEYPVRAGGDSVATPNQNPQLIPQPNLKPGHRFFILNGEDLFTYPFQSDPQVNLKYDQPEQIPIAAYQQPQIPQQRDTGVNTLPIQTILLRNGVTNQIANVQDLGIQQKLPENFVTLNQGSQDPFFRSSLPISIPTHSGESIQQVGEGKSNDAVVIDAKGDEAVSGANSGSNTGTTSALQKSAEPSTAQAAPGALALAGVGGVAGAAPRGTALVGKGGLAISSPQATAVAGTKNNSEKDKNPNSRAK
ncbi:hypothetical protein NQ317_016487 [Molorchus minor]|uniref:DUF4774 domain-containing protein n=1 Tax=Molorchus minor TaxID=1323400 RepID=A0ABQ9JFX9_9CUCU|nr:hypothetical protein NQ317_016487 [Molorchus minor]